MSFLKSMWKNGSRHKKLGEEMALASSLRDFSESPLDLHDEEVPDEPTIFNLKYLGSTVMSSSKVNDQSNKKIKLSKKSQLITTSAIKSVISASKSQKKISEVSLAISPKGIETFDPTTKENLWQVPICNISYCSIDADYDTIFAFVNMKSENLNEQTEALKTPEQGRLESSSCLDSEDGLVLHAFQCHKRKVAHNVTMTVARAFERAYQIYQNERFLDETPKKQSNNHENSGSEHNSKNIKKLIASENKEKDENESQSLIDLGSVNGPQSHPNDMTRDFSQKTWVSFE